jgi:hypothetical protein
MAHTWQAQIEIESSDDVGAEERLTTAHARLITATGMELEGFGRSRRRPEDREVPEIGDELAVARALRDLADRLLKATSDDLSVIEHHKIRLAR